MFSSLFKTKLRDTGKITDIDRIFSYLKSLTLQPDSARNYENKFQDLKEKEHKKGQEIYIDLYLEWEDYLLSNNSSLNSSTTKESLRRQIARTVNLENIDDRFRLIFLPEREQRLIIYELGIEQLSKYLIKNLGFDAFVKLISSIGNNTVFAQVSYKDKTISFERLNHLIITKESEYTIEKITKIFRGFISTFYNKIELTLGEKMAQKIFKKIYEDFHEKYNAEFATLLLKVTPEKVLKMNEWLSLLSKEELEKQIREQTLKLENINVELEEKVKERTQELEKAYEELKELDRKKSEFISIAAHQIRTPASGIKWVLDLFLQGEVGDISDEQKSLLEKAHVANERLIYIANDMLDTDLISTGNIKYHFEKINPIKILQNTIKEMEPQSQSKNISIAVSTNTAPDLQIEADKIRFQIVIQNLLDNAIKYSRPNSEVRIETSNTPTNFEMKFVDKGIGIPEDQKDEIFKRFFRASNSVRFHANGSGLGLFIAKNIVEGHKGSLTFNSKENQGATFIVRIPIVQGGK